MTKMRTTLALVALLGLGACANNPYGYGPSGSYGNKEVGGALVGAAAGGLLGSRFGKGSGQLAATAAGTLIGAFVGASIGRGLDERDRLYAAQATEHALDAGGPGETIAWNNPSSGNSGTVTPGPAYAANGAGYCREFQQTITVGGQAQSAYGTACRQPDGSWQIVS